MKSEFPFSWMQSQKEATVEELATRARHEELNNLLLIATRGFVLSTSDLKWARDEHRKYGLELERTRMSPHPYLENCLNKCYYIDRYFPELITGGYGPYFLDYNKWMDYSVNHAKNQGELLLRFRGRFNGFTRLIAKQQYINPYSPNEIKEPFPLDYNYKDEWDEFLRSYHLFCNNPGYFETNKGQAT